MPQTLSSTKPINNNSSIGFANDNFGGSFCAFSSNNFQSKNFKNNPYSPKNAVCVFLTLKPIAKNADGSLKTNDNGTFETVSGIGGLGGSFGNNGAQANIGMGEGESSLDQTTFTNSQLVAKNMPLEVISRNTNI